MTLKFSYDVTYLIRDVLIFKYKNCWIVQSITKLFLRFRTLEYHIRHDCFETDFMKMCQKNVTELENYGGIGRRGGRIFICPCSAIFKAL